MIDQMWVSMNAVNLVPGAHLFFVFVFSLFPNKEALKIVTELR